MLADIGDNGKVLRCLYAYVDYQPGEDGGALRRKIFSTGIWPADGTLVTYEIAMHCCWTEPKHIMTKLNGDFSFFSDTEREEIFPNRHPPVMTHDTGLYVILNGERMLKRHTLWYCHTTNMFLSNQPVIKRDMVASYQKHCRHLEISDELMCQKWFDEAASSIECMVSTTREVIFPLTTISPVQTATMGESVDGPDPEEGFGTKLWFEKIGKIVEQSKLNDAVPQKIKYHQMRAIKKKSQALGFKINGEVFHGVIGDQEDPDNIRKCSQCQNNFILGTTMCPNLFCTGPITKEVRDDIILKQAHRVWDMFQNNEYLEDWQLAGYLGITRDHPLNKERDNTDAVSAANVARYIDKQMVIFCQKLKDGWVRPQFEVV